MIVGNDIWEITGNLEEVGIGDCDFVITDLISKRSKNLSEIDGRFRLHPAMGDTCYRLVIQEDIAQLWVNHAVRGRICLTGANVGFEQGSWFFVNINDDVPKNEEKSAIYCPKVGAEADVSGLQRYLTKIEKTDEELCLWCLPERENGAATWQAEGNVDTAVVKSLLVGGMKCDNSEQLLLRMPFEQIGQAHIRAVIVKQKLYVYINGKKFAAQSLPEWEAATEYLLGFGICGTEETTQEILQNLRVRSGNQVRTLDEIYMLDPCVLADNGKYYMYGTRYNHYLNVLESVDMRIWERRRPCFCVHWSECVGENGFWGDGNILWAPEVYHYRDAYYMFVTSADYTKPGKAKGIRGVGVLRAESPLGPFRVWSDGAVTPTGHRGIDGTLYIQDGVPYMIYSHEWDCEGCAKDNQTGKIAYIPLSEDLKRATGESTQWFTGNIYRENRMKQNALAEGPYVYEKEGRRFLLWTTVTEKYTALCSNFEKLGDEITTENVYEMFTDDGGHSMTYTDHSGNDIFVLHAPNMRGKEENRAVLFDVRIDKLNLALTRH